MEMVSGCTVIPRAADPGMIPSVQPRRRAPTTFSPPPPGEEAAPPPHVHPTTDEAFYVAEGLATFLLGDQEIKVEAGGFVFVPRGTIHTVINAGDGPSRGLLIISPGDAEHVFVPAEDEAEATETHRDRVLEAGPRQAVHARTSAPGPSSRWFATPAIARVISSSASSVRSMWRTPASPPSARPCTYGRPMTTASAPRASAR